MIVYYSKSGHSEAIAKEISNLNGMEIVHIEDQKQPGFVKGAVLAIRKKEGKLKEIPKLTVAEQVIVVAPIWADVFPPAINTILPILKNHPNVVYIASCTHKDGNERYNPKIQKVLPNAKVIALYENIEMNLKIDLINQIF